MRRSNELLPRDLKDICNPNLFKFETTKELVDTTDLIYGQERGIRALNFGLDIDIKGYNIYLEGPSGVGKTMYTKKFLKARAEKDKIPNDWCYIYNFEDPNAPVAISFPAGQGKVFKETMESFVKDIRKDIKKTFNNDDFEKEKKVIKQQYDQKRDNLLEKLNKRTIVQGFQVKSTENGMYMMPVLDGKTLAEDEFDNLDENIKKEFEERSNLVQEQIFEALSEMKVIEKETEMKIEEWQANIALMTINVHINSVKANYKRNKKISTYLDGIKKDILKNIGKFLEPDPDPKTPQQLQPGQRPEIREPWLNYRVNLLVDNSKLEGAPVIMDTNYSYNNIFGGLEYENQYGMLKTDFTMIKPGLLHLANGGYIMFQAKDLLANSVCYEALKKFLRIKEIAIENVVDQRSSMMMVSLKPEPIPLDLKVLIVGNSNIYHTLLSMDDDFRKLFKIKVEFEEDAPKTTENIERLSNFVRSFCVQEGLLDLDKEAMAKVIEFSSKLAGDKEKLSTQFSEIGEIVGEASAWAKLDKVKIITKEYVQKAFDERIDRIKKYDTKYLQMIKEEALLIETEGYKVGQINGLTVITIGDYSFGKPAKITSNTYMGKEGVVNIEREVEMSGSSHSKGILILTGYLGEQFAQDMPLSLTASVCFEQLYGGVDGDSASSTEAYAILSSLSGIPINQSIAVTGSVNQKGEIQPIGGVNEKIEGFYQICKMRGFNGQHGVIIPAQNVRNLHLSDEVIDSVRKGKFHIYSVRTIDEGIEILTGVPAGKKDKNGNFPLGTINYLVNERLKKFSNQGNKVK
ncbi:MAG: ATP-binding protein [Clostridia bacterium]|nr:ATP-binding protein [Clostridia bacterium]